MKKSIILLMALSLTLLFSCKEQEQYEKITKTDENGYSYEAVKGDPLEARIYTLENGLKVYMAKNPDQPRIMTMVAVRAGSKNDPRETTGLAHYFEHIMFKGTDEVGTLDWEKEKKLIAEISDLFEEHKNTTDKEKKKAIYKKIDNLSQEAAKYAIPNEYDKSVSVLGAKMTNAFTSYDVTAYMNDIPSNEIERWLKLESERFEDPVLRLFHTELETVYEEFNMTQDNDWRQTYVAAYKELFKNHPYGVSVIGKGEHLKNPSMVNILNFKEQYYVPNNMAICLMGDLDHEKTIELIDKYWGGKKTVENIPDVEFEPEKPIESPVVKEVYGPDREFVSIFYRTPKRKSDETKYFKLIDKILNNSQAGLIDLDLVKSQKVQRAYCSFSSLNDYGTFMLTGYPRKDQSLEEVKGLLLEEVEKVKNGDFDEWLVEAVVNEMKLNRIRRNDKNWAVYTFVDAFIAEMDWLDAVKGIDEMSKIKKEELVKFAKEQFKDNYVVVYKRNGENKDKQLVEKPPLTPVNINRNDHSEFFTQFTKNEPENIKPEFINFDEKLKRDNLDEGIDFFYTKNPSNQLGMVYYVVEMGKDHMKKLPVAMEYLKYTGTDKYSLEALNKEFYKVGINYHVGSSDDKSYVYISGLDENLEEGIQLLEHLLANAKADEEAYKKVVQKILKERENDKLSKRTILWQGMYNYAKHDGLSSFNDIIPEEELKNINPQELVDVLKDLFKHEHKIFYYGPQKMETAKKMIAKLHSHKEELLPIPAKKEYPEKDIKQNKVFFCDYDMVQAQVVLLSKDKTFDPSELPQVRMFNEYYGGSMGSVIFQEMREAAGLAYSAWAGYRTPSEKDKSNYVFAYIATQPDKIKTALDRYKSLLNEMTESEEAFKDSKQSIIKQINTDRIIKEQVFFTYLYNKQRGIDKDYRENVYEGVKNFSLADVKTFFNSRIKGKQYNYLVLGDKDLVDMEALAQYGEVEELSLKDIFNY